jgi:hypothetical protein
MMMAEGLTLEDIKRSFLFYKNNIDQLSRELLDVLSGFQTELTGRSFGQNQRRVLETELDGLKTRAESLLKDLVRVGSAVTATTPNQATTSYTVGG